MWIKRTSRYKHSVFTQPEQSNKFRKLFQSTVTQPANQEETTASHITIFTEPKSRAATVVSITD